MWAEGECSVGLHANLPTGNGAAASLAPDDLYDEDVTSMHKWPPFDCETAIAFGCETSSGGGNAYRTI